MPFDISRLVPAIQELAEYYAHYAPDLLTRTEQARVLLNEVGQEELQKAAESMAPRVLAYPLEEPAWAYPAAPAPPPYRILASDGSDIAPDAHLALKYALLHVAVVGMGYSPPEHWTEQQASFFFRPEQLTIVPPRGDSFPVDALVVDTMRSYRELAELWAAAERVKARKDKRPLLALTDAVILWRHRGTGDGPVSFGDQYMSNSIAVLAKFQQAGIPLASFDVTAHSEVVNTLLAQQCSDPMQMDCARCRDRAQRCLILNGMDDGTLFQFLPAGARSALFQHIHHGNRQFRLPRDSREMDPELAFFYLNTGPQITRVELPLWIVKAGLLELLQGVLMHQCQAVRTYETGYPISLALAHEEAILTTADRQSIQIQVTEALARRGIFVTSSVKALMKG